MSKEVEVVRGNMRQSFSEEEKQRIVADSLQTNLSLNQFAKRIGIAPPTLCVWRKRFKATKGENTTHSIKTQDITVHMTPNKDQVEELQKQNQELRTELFHLKSAFGSKLIQLELDRTK